MPPENVTPFLEGELAMTARMLAAATAAMYALMMGIVTPVTLAHAKSDSEIENLIQRWHEANYQCRGGSGDESKQACGKRDVLDELLDDRGYCHGKIGEYPIDNKWHRWSEILPLGRRMSGAVA